MLIRNLKEEDRMRWISMRGKLWPDAPIGKLIKDAIFIEAGECPEECQYKMKVFMLEDDSGKLCGFIEVSLRKNYKYCTSSPVGFIEGLYIENHCRKNGWGGRLMKKAEEWIKSEGGKEIASIIDAYRKAGIEAYVALGYIMVFADYKKVKFIKDLERCVE